jgi:hypothetical protein
MPSVIEIVQLIVTLGIFGAILYYIIKMATTAQINAFPVDKVHSPLNSVQAGPGATTPAPAAAKKSNYIKKGGQA